MRSIFLVLGLMLSSVFLSNAQDLPTFDWKISSSMDNAEAGDTLRLMFMTDIKEGLHIYGSTFECEFGPNPSRLDSTEATGLNLEGSLISKGVITEYDDIFMCELNYFKKHARFEQKVAMTGSSGTVSGILEYQVCLENGMCILQKEPFTIRIE